MTEREAADGEGTTRRTFLKAGGAAAVAGCLAGGPFVHASDKAGSGKPIVGAGEHTYEVTHGWGRLPAGLAWGDTHGVAMGGDGAVYIAHASAAAEPLDAIVVFDPEGNYIRSFGKAFHGGGHGLDLRREGNEEFLYLCDIKNRQVVKLSTSGDVVWTRGLPEQAGVYQSPEQFRATNVAFAPDGGFFVADGYGSSYIHRYDREGHWVKTFGGAGSEAGQLRCPHGLWWDDRPGRTPALVVADRANSRLQYFTADGEHLGFVPDLTHPCHFDIRGTDLLVPDLHSRVTVLDGENRVIAHLAEDPTWTQRVQREGLRGRPDQWPDGRFVHPHDAAWDSQGNILVAEWVPIGRLSLLRRV